ncbi:MAG: hypothetical protein RIR25_1927 [Verrucomicrobiota bacterium]|jgi:hypothetical protein
MIHELKSLPEPFSAIVSGEQSYDIRLRDNRDFRVGDILVLREWDRGKSDYTGLVVSRQVVHITKGPGWPWPEDMVVMGLQFAPNGRLNDAYQNDAVVRATIQSGGSIEDCLVNLVANLKALKAYAVRESMNSSPQFVVVTQEKYDEIKAKAKVKEVA